MTATLSARPPGAAGSTVRIMLAGDVMLGRGIDQILPHPSPPELHESYARSALLYVELAKRRGASLARPVPFRHVWGDAVDDLAGRALDLRIINLETAITRSSAPAEKGIHYRMEPANIPVLHAAAIDACILANNHVLDWGEAGLLETLDVLDEAGIRTVGAGRNDREAEAPAIFPFGATGRVLVYACAMPGSGVPPGWSATPDRPGVAWLARPDAVALAQIAARTVRDRRPGDIVILSIHWGPNWGYDIPEADRDFARRLVDEAGVDLVHGHSSHHPKAAEIHGGRAILYGCGDLLNDYEGIEGEESYRPDLALIYLLTLERNGRCRQLEMLPYRIRGFRLNRAEPGEARWLRDRLDRECRHFGGHVTLADDPARGPSLRLDPVDPRPPATCDDSPLDAVTG